MIAANIGILASSGRVPLLLDTYTGAAVAFSVRKLRTAYAGYCMNVVRSSDSTNLDIGFVNGVLDTASLLTFVGASRGNIRKWYDQSGNGNDLTQTTGTKQPIIVVAGTYAIVTEGGEPALNFDGTDVMTLATPLSGLASQSFSHFVVQRRPLTTSMSVIFGGVSNNPFSVMIAASGNINIANRTTYRYVANATTTQCLLSGFNVATDNLSAYLNGTDLGVGNDQAVARAVDFTVVGQYYTTYSIGNVSEMIFYLSNQTSNRVGIEGNINGYFGIY